MKFNQDVRSCYAAPIAEAWSWVADRGHPDLLDLCQGVSARPPPAQLLEYLADAIRAGHGATYTDICGLASLRKALAEDIRQSYAGDAEAADVVITAGCNQAFCSVIDSLCSRGDEVIMALPCYFNHSMWLNIRAVGARYIPYNPDSGEPELAAARRLIGPRTRAIALVTPNNPTGAIYSSHCIEGFFQLAKEAGLALIIDETYRDLTAADAPLHGLFDKPDWRETFIHLYSFSKAYSLTGHRVGAVACGPGPRAQLEKILDCTAICAPHVGQLAACYGLRHLGDWKRRNTGQLLERIKTLRKAFSHPSLNYRLLSAGAYFAWVKHPFQDTAREVARRLIKEHLLVCLPGSYFGPDQDAYLRLAFANLEVEQFPEVVRRLLASC